ncbi:TniB family NTP-binding protein [Phenylobacterium sp. LjRoot225]|uniref:TniB family NTP-binding protein n=1 Tax=Phenylobacterium sp. LjRoot225 TaxID=3342285 RepID=UPI003ED095FC
MVNSSAEALALDDDARIALILSDRWVSYPQGTTVLRWLEDLLRGARRTRMPSLLVVGDPDMGKTTILRKFMRSQRSDFDAASGLSRMEVVAMEAPPEADEMRFYAAVLEAIGAPTPAGRVIDMERAVHGQLGRLQTRLLVIDETNNLVIGSAAAQRKTLAALRRLSNTLSMSMAYFGTLEALNALASDPQIEGRAQPYRLARMAKDETYGAIVSAVVAHLPLRMRSEVDAAFVDAVHEISGGSPGKTFRLLNAAGVEAVDSGRECITVASLRADEVVRHVRTASAMRRGAGAFG